MVIKALDLSKTRVYVSKLDTGDDPTKWHIGTLSSRDKGAIRDSATSFSFTNDDIARAKARAAGDAPDADDDNDNTLDTKVERSKMNFEAVRRGLRGWENFLDGSGQPIPFKTVLRDVGGGVRKSVVPSDVMDLIPLEIIDELASQIMADFSKDDDAGN